MNGLDARNVLQRAERTIQTGLRTETAIPDLLLSVQQLERDTEDLRVAAKLTTIRLCIERLHAAPTGCDAQLRGIALTALSELLRVQTD